MSETGDVIAVAAGILRGPATGFMSITRMLACAEFEGEALAGWLENHPGDPRAARAAREICDASGVLLDAELRAVSERGAQQP